MNAEMKKSKEALSTQQQKAMTDAAHASRHLNKLSAELEQKEVNMMQLNSDVAWSHERIAKLEEALQSATKELTRKTDASSKWELQCGELHQKIIDLERVRKALTSQLHALRQELLPKEEKLVKTSERLQEMNQEYELALHAISEKEKVLSQKGENLNLLQKQVRELRTSSSRKDGLLRRAATLFSEYKDALQKAQFVSQKRTVMGGNNNGSLVGAGNTSGILSALAGPLHQGSSGAGTAGQTNTASTSGNNNGNSNAPITMSLEDKAAQQGGGGGVAGGGTGGGASSGNHVSKRKNNESALAKNKESSLVEIIVENEGMKLAMRRLADVLNPFLTEDIVDIVSYRSLFLCEE
jgi:hypothetical protein